MLIFLKIDKVNKPHIVLIIARGEAIRNFVFSDMLKELSRQSRITILSLITDGEITNYSSSFVKQIIPLKRYKENSFVIFFREIIHTAHYRWNWTEASKYYWHRHDKRVKGDIKKTLKLLGWRVLGRPLAFKKILYLVTKVERWLSWFLRPTNDFDVLFKNLKPDFVFNCSHVHGVDADLPMKIASNLGFKTGAFIFSWDNLFTRSRIFPKYDYYFTWNRKMSKHLIKLYDDEININNIYVTGTPQFDFHFKPNYKWDKRTLYNEIGLELDRPYILYTTAMYPVFLEEHRMVNSIIKFLKKIEKVNRPQLVIRTYVKGNSNEMVSLAEKFRNDDDVIFPAIKWDKDWNMPFYKDLYIYTNLLRYASLGINAASTVSMELMIYNKPVINLGFEPPGSSLPYWTRFSQHVDYEHYVPLVKSKSVMVAKSLDDLGNLIIKSLNNPKCLEEAQKIFLDSLFKNHLDGLSAQRIAKTILKIIKENEK